MSIRRIGGVGTDRTAAVGRNRLRRLGGALGAASVVLAAAACGGDDDSSGRAGATTAASAVTNPPAPSGAGREGSSATGGRIASDGSTIKIGYLGPLSGTLVPTFAPILDGIQSYVKYWNDRGGVNGHMLELSVYDTQSNASAVLAGARKAVGEGVQTLIGNDVYFDTAAPYLAEQGMPVFGFGNTLGFYGPEKQTFFSPMGNWIAYQSNVGMQYLVDQGHEKIAVLSDPTPGNANAAQAIANAVATVGGELVYENYGVDTSNAGALLALAERAKDAGAEAVYTNFFANAPAQLQANLNQIDADAIVLNGNLGFAPDIPGQFGSSVEGLTSEVFTATWLSPSIPGVKSYMEAMQEYAPDMLENNSALIGWATMVLFGGALDKLGDDEPTWENITAAANRLEDFDGDGLMQPVTFPDMHESMAPCMGFGQIQGGEWKLTAGTATDPFVCGTPVAATD